MGRAPCCDKANVKRGPWSPEEDAKLKEFIDKFGTGGNWIALPQKAGLKRCGKSCRLRWLNYLRPNIKHGEFSDEEDRVICTLYATIGSRWSIIAGQLPGRTDNDIKNYWNTKLKKKLMGIMINNPILSNQPKLISQPISSPISLNQSQLSQPLSQLYRDHYTSFYNFQAAAKSLSTTVESLNSSAPQTFLYGNNHELYSYYQQNQDQGLLDLQCNYGKDHNNMLIFGGGNEVSCSSPDGSCSQISYGKDHQGFNISNGRFDQENQKFMLQYGKIINHGGFDNLEDQKLSGVLENSQLECDLEEVKELISTDNNGNSLSFNDENKTPDQKVYYYY